MESPPVYIFLIRAVNSLEFIKVSLFNKFATTSFDSCSSIFSTKIKIFLIQSEIFKILYLRISIKTFYVVSNIANTNCKPNDKRVGEIRIQSNRVSLVTVLSSQNKK